MLGCEDELVICPRSDTLKMVNFLLGRGPFIDGYLEIPAASGEGRMYINNALDTTIDTTNGEREQ